jgi:CheY-like chemotaxis protein
MLMSTILVVDDYAVARRILTHTLGRHGYTIITAADGLEALAKLDAETIDLAIIDIAMPGMDGLTLLSQLREREALVKLPVIMLSASGQDEDRKVARALGAHDFLSKPASSHEILAVVGRHLD